MKKTLILFFIIYTTTMIGSEASRREFVLAIDKALLAIRDIGRGTVEDLIKYREKHPSVILPQIYFDRNLLLAINPTTTFSGGNSIGYVKFKAKELNVKDKDFNYLISFLMGFGSPDRLRCYANSSDDYRARL